MGRPSRMPTGSISVTSDGAPTLRGRAWPGVLASTARALVLVTVASFALDLSSARIAVSSLTRPRIRGWLAGLALALLLALVVSLVIGALRALSARSAAAPRPDPLGRVRGWLWGGDAAQQRGRVASLLGASWAFGAYALGAFAATRALVVEVAQPRFAAAAITAAHVALAAVALALFPRLRALADYVARLGQAPALRWLLGRAGALVAVSAGTAVVAALYAGFKSWGVLQYLPWQRTLAIAGAPVGAYLLIRAFAALGRAGVALERVVLACAFVSTLGALFAYSGRGDELSGLRQTEVGRLGMRAALLALDFDRDGVLSVLGGGDCAPFDARLSPLAMDIPNDHLDQDCDGIDLDDKLLGPPPRHDFKLPKGLPRRPLIVLLTIDAFAARRTGGFGYARNVTPRIDAYARGGSLFRFAFSQGPSTRLSFPSIFTSRYDSQIAQRLVGGHPYPIEDSELMLAELLAGEGYDTTAVLSDGYFRKSRWGSLLAGFTKVVDSAIGTPGKHNSVEVTDAAIKVLEQRRPKPLFLWVHYYDAHSPHSQPKDTRVFGTTRADIYDAELELVDREAGRLLDYIETSLGGQAMVFITGDHGIAFDDARHARLNYGYDLSTVVLHVPLIVRGPQVRTQVNDRLASTMDIAPTIANLLKVKRPLPYEGASLVPELFEGAQSRPQVLMHQFFLEERKWDEADPLEQVSLRDEAYSLIHDRKHGGYQLYDFRNDYYEARDLSAEPASKARLTAMRQQLALLTYRTYSAGRQREQLAQALRKDGP